MCDGAFLSVMKSQHLVVGVHGRNKKLCYHHSLSSTFCFSYQNVSKVDLRARMTTEQWLRGSGKLRARDLPCARFLADGWHYKLDNDQLCLWPSRSA